MTQAAPLFRRTLILLVLGGAVALPAPAQPEARPPAPADWVARVKTRHGNRYLTLGRLADAVLWRKRESFKELGSGPLTILKQLIEERVVEQEARRLGIRVSTADLQQRYRQLDRDVRSKTNGNRNLSDVVRRDMKITEAEFREQLRYLMMKERVAGHQEWLRKLPANEHAKLAQIEVVIAELLKKAALEYCFPTALQDPPSECETGVVVEVNGEPIKARELGEALVKRLKTSDITSVIQEECRAVLTADWALTPEQMEEVIAKERAEWESVRKLATQEVLHTLPYEDFVRVRFRLDLDRLKQDRYYRGLFGLMRSYRDQVTDDEVRKDWEENRTTIWGDRYLVTDIQILFQPRQQALLGPSSGRTYKEALKLANALLRRIHGGAETFDEIVSDINKQQDATFLAKRVGVRNTDNERFLYEQAKLLQDKAVSRPFETLTEVHVVRREKHVRAPTFEEVADTIRQRIAFRRARDYLEERMTNPEVVEIRWPPPPR